MNTIKLFKQITRFLRANKVVMNTLSNVEILKLAYQSGSDQMKESILDFYMTVQKDFEDVKNDVIRRNCVEESINGIDLDFLKW